MAEPDHDNDPDAARRKLIELLSDEDTWEFTNTVSRESKQALRLTLGAALTECAVADYVVDQLTRNFPLLRTLLGEPPGSGGVGWVLNNPDGHRTYIKIKIEQDGVHEYALILSCHTSKHS